jgi:carbon storage regulator
VFTISRAKNEAIIINESITVTVLEIDGDEIRLEIDAPDEMYIAAQSPRDTAAEPLVAEVG